MAGRNYRTKSQYGSKVEKKLRDDLYTGPMVCGDDTHKSLTTVVKVFRKEFKKFLATSQKPETAEQQQLLIARAKEAVRVPVKKVFDDLRGKAIRMPPMESILQAHHGV